jgi:hypothetical protein
MREQAPVVPTPNDLAIEAAQGANIAYGDLLVAKAARAVIEAAAVAADNLGLEGVRVEPQAYGTLDAKIHEAEENFELYGQMVGAVMPAREKAPEEQHTQEVAQDSSAAPAPQPGKHEPKANARPTTQELIKQKEEPKQQYTSILYELLTRGDENGVCEGENVDEVIRLVVGATQRQWNQRLTQLKQWHCITTEPGENGRIAKFAVDWDMVEVNMGLGKVSPFPDGLTATEIMKAKWDASDQADRAPKPLTSEPPAAETEPAITSNKESLAPEAARQTSRAAGAESKPASKELYTKLLRQVLLQVDSSGTYESENLEAELSQELGMTPTKLRSLARKLIAWQCISATPGPEGDLIGITVDAAMVDREIIKQRIALFPDQKTATNLLKSRQRELARSAPDDDEAAAANNPAAGDSPPPPPAEPVYKLSAQVRRQVARDKQAGQAAPDTGKPNELEQEIMELSKDAQSLTEDQHYMLEPLSQVALAFLDETILAGSTREDIGKQLVAITGLPPEKVIHSYGVIKSRGFLWFSEEGEVRIPQLTQAFKHFLRNVIQDVKENS